VTARKAENFLLDMGSLLEDQGKRSGHISNILKAAKSWFKFNRKHIEELISVSIKTSSIPSVRE
jgi:hypothetical protein